MVTSNSPAFLRQLVILASQSGKVLRIAHGGAINPSQANSLEGICDSIARGVDAVELDVQITRDGEPVLFHDKSLPVNGRPTSISDLSLSELESTTMPGELHSIPKLREVLDFLRDRNTLILLDIKSPRGIDAVIRMILNAKATEKTLIASFDYRPLTRVKKLCPLIPTIVTVGLSRTMLSPLGVLWTLFALLFPLLAANRVKANVILCPLYRVTKQLIAKAHERAIAVLVWKLTDQTKTSYVVDIGADGIVTNWQR